MVVARKDTECVADDYGFRFGGQVVFGRMSDEELSVGCNIADMGTKLSSYCSLEETLPVHSQATACWWAPFHVCSVKTSIV